MAKSIRCKVKKRLRTVKRQRMDAMVCAPRIEQHHKSLLSVANGTQVKLSKVKNAFKYPNDADAAFPQHEVVKPMDFRCQSLPMAGYAFRGNRRKYVGEQAEFMKDLAKTSHPKMEVLAGGGMVMATTGQKVSCEEASRLATLHANPQALAMAPVSAASAVEAAVADEEVPQAPEEVVEEKEPDDHADHSRRPVLKDDRRAKRTAEHRPRANKATQKKSLKKKANKSGADGGDAAMRD